MKQLLILGAGKGYRHEAVSHAIATIERLGRDTGLWTTTIRTDTEVLTKKKLEYNAKNLNNFDAVLFYTGGELEMDPEQKAALLSFVHDEKAGVLKMLLKRHATSRNLLFGSNNRAELQTAFDSTWDSAVSYTILLEAGRKILYKRLGSVDILELRRTILANLPSDYIGFYQHWQSTSTQSDR
jgi:hypothetical protein